jgi:hypothetical protein
MSESQGCLGFRRRRQAQRVSVESPSGDVNVHTATDNYDQVYVPIDQATANSAEAIH